MIPDKIYFPEDGLPAYIDWDGSPVSTKPVGDNPICYIRKEALLEWAENWKKLGMSDDFLYAMETLIYHMNLM